jgi:hypothetical protein
MTPRVAAVLSTVLATLLVPASAALGSGNGLRRYNDGAHNGVVATFSNSTAEDRFMQEYPPNLLSQGSVVCAGRVEHRNENGSAPFTNFEIRWEDPANPGYCDVSPAGLIAVADAFSFGECGFGDNVSQPTFLNGAGVPIDSAAAFYFTAILPIQSNPDCGILVDTNNPDYHRGKVYDSSTGQFSEAANNLMLDVYVSEPGYFRFALTMRGRQRYPGDPGLPVMFARRPKTGGVFPQTDDLISATLVYDNLVGAPVTREFTMEADRSSLNPNLGYRYVPLFRFAGTTAAFRGPITLPAGRTRIAIEVQRPLPDGVLPVLPINMRFRARSWDPDFATGTPTSVTDFLGLRPYAGVLDDGSPETYSLVRSPGALRDAMGVRLRAVDLPRTAPFTITGIEIVGREVGGSGLEGFDAVEVRRDDFLVTAAPDMSPLGLLTSSGIVDGVGEVPAPGPTIIDVPDVAIDPTGPRSNDLWIVVFQRVGDRTSAGTTLGLDTTADTLLSESYTSLAGTLPFRPLTTQGNFMARLVLDGRSSTLDDGGLRDGGDGDVPVRDLSAYEYVDYRGR